MVGAGAAGAGAAGGGGGATEAGWLGGAELPDLVEEPELELLRGPAGGVDLPATLTYLVLTMTFGGGAVTGVNRRTTSPPSGGAGMVGVVVVGTVAGVGGVVVLVADSAVAARMKTVVVPQARAAAVQAPIRAIREAGMRLTADHLLGR